jgi:hypothetical protein
MDLSVMRFTELSSTIIPGKVNGALQFNLPDALIGKYVMGVVAKLRVSSSSTTEPFEVVQVFGRIQEGTTHVLSLGSFKFDDASFLPVGYLVPNNTPRFYIDVAIAQVLTATITLRGEIYIYYSATNENIIPDL